TWKWDEDAPEEEHETLLTLDFTPHGNGTELTLTHELLASEESRSNHEHGWSTVIDKMERL
ncbi:MAG: SRPBCC domain-containing protein, partial [Candidatus Eremiobacteraeota bacterium]|nr:SRPBCC domain-containing protein [Candidatus Eremiobacteraeota bacterium]